MRTPKLIIVIMLVPLIAGCSPPNTTPKPAAKPLVVDLSGPTVAVAGGYADINATPGRAKFTFIPEEGFVVHQEGRHAVWQAPNSPGVYTTTVVGVLDDERVIAKREIAVKWPPAVVTDWELLDYTFDNKSVRLTVENATEKPIAAVRARMILINSSGERLRYGIGRTFSGEATGLTLSPSDSADVEWVLRFAPTAHLVLPWIEEVMFDDGSVWRLRD